MKRGFTLIELLVVIAIIGILVSIFISAVQIRVKVQQKESVMVEHVKATKFPIKKASADSVIAEAWFDDTESHILWLQSKDGDLVCVPSGKAMELLKKLIRRGRNP